MNKNLYVLFLGLCLISCQPKNISNESTSTDGFNRFGLSETCQLNENVCQSFGWDLDKEKDFQDKCLLAGHELIPCSCGPSLCSGKISTGIDINGTERSCAAIPDSQNCTMEFTLADQFAEDCKDQGGKPVACDCHDFICTEMPQE